ncbi:hypothetical protein L596_013246 [Steinernema carpocapsae]|uniref:Glutamine-dependent NAD(+) synthetase n=1 Tax=Steinernema carpocapsae TaxID=34508 RepID=A0A4U5P0E3_STECR|nr:hypothetical protein L596_013246 [Steinernema carpocapsae]
MRFLEFGACFSVSIASVFFVSKKVLMESQSPRCVTVAVATVNNWSLDFDGNLKRILETCRQAYDQGAKIRVGPELEIPGYGCADHFFEVDTELHSWEILAEIVEVSKNLKDFMIVTGMPVKYKNALYTCMVSVLNGKILLIRPKLHLRNDDIFRESRYFAAWNDGNKVVDYKLPPFFGFKQERVLFGNAIITTSDNVKIGFETNENQWQDKTQDRNLTLANCDIVINSSVSHHVMGESRKRVNAITTNASSDLKVVYLYANHRGCDGERLYYDGMSTIAQDGVRYRQISQFDIEDTAVVICSLDLKPKSKAQREVPEIAIKNKILVEDSKEHTSEPLSDILIQDVEELCHGPPAWLWHYLRRSGKNGFFLPLSGGKDSAAVSVMVRLMCEKIVKAVKDHPESNDPAYYFEGQKVNCSARDLCSQILFTCYMGTENSSDLTKNMSRGLAEDIGATHSVAVMDGVVGSYMNLCNNVHNYVPSFTREDPREGLACQNIQARSRMVAAYLFAQNVLLSAGRKGTLLVLGTTNLDESLIGYLTKYDCSSADINPIGSLNKVDLKRFLHHVIVNYPFPYLKQVYDTRSSAELCPLVDGKIAQDDEIELGLTYEELSVFGRLRRPDSKGPFAMFLALVPMWHPKQTHEQIAEKVVTFFERYIDNRHKTTVLTPSYRATVYANDNHRSDHRPFLYPDFNYQYSKIRKLAKQLASKDIKQ